MGKRGVLIALGVLIAVVAGTILANRSPRPARTIGDRQFAAAATDRCAATVPRFRADPQQNRREERNERQTAERVERAASALEDMVDDLAEIDVAAPDRDRVATWLQAWRDYIGAGRQYARAVRTGDADEFSREADASRTSLDIIGRFARANRMDACVP